MMTEWIEGGWAIVRHTGSTVPSGVYKVAKAGKSKVTLSDGSEWTAAGRRWGQHVRGTYSYQYASPATDEQAAKAKAAIGRVRLINTLRGIDWSKLDDATLAAVFALLPEGGK